MVAPRREMDAHGMSQPVVAAIDPASEDVAPAALGLMLAKLTSGSLLLAAAFPADSTPDDPTGAAIRRVRALVEDAAAQSVRVDTVLVPCSRSPATALRELAEGEQAGMLVIGSSRRDRLRRVLPGAVTDRLLHGAPCAVAVAPKGFSFADALGGPRLIGVAFVDTPAGRAALGRACTLASRARALVRILTVREPPNPVLAGMLDPPADEQFREGREHAVEAALARGLDAVRIGRSAGGEILSGEPAEALAAASHDLDLLVCGSRGYGPIRSLLLGSTSQALVRKAACPVLIVPLSEAAPMTRTAVVQQHAAGVDGGPPRAGCRLAGPTSPAVPARHSGRSSELGR